MNWTNNWLTAGLFYVHAQACTAKKSDSNCLKVILHSINNAAIASLLFQTPRGSHFCSDDLFCLNSKNQCIKIFLLPMGCEISSWLDCRVNLIQTNGYSVERLSSVGQASFVILNPFEAPTTIVHCDWDLPGQSCYFLPKCATFPIFFIKNAQCLSCFVKRVVCSNQCFQMTPQLCREV